ncbi:DNA-binding PadR family transcriptional regulator [Aurantimicrobium minutum]|uniref:PadR family transcriptional regulator n=1 Tax=Aurantimicrobium minutum TaxID=708131 RepID=UPI002474AA8D|nr:PadR family transcriptional regulator [Aurantimicrobium minutum]MDH6533073.1 DNA-binding PadR family transcriptional regulator [Aurantimicrobium minutum]
MAVRESLLGLLTLGPAYGLQLHAELASRAPHRAKTNVGQVYGTLDRLSTAGLVIHDGLTPDGLPLYALTSAGKSDAHTWLRGDELTTVPEWADLQDMVLISASIDSRDAEFLLTVVDKFCQLASEPSGSTEADTLHHLAHLRYLEAVHNWISDVRSAQIQPQAGYALGRPKRGRPAKS